MILSIHQPAYLPWLGYFEKISRSDLFVYLDTVQYEKNSFINRNKIKTSQGVAWLSIPIKTKGHIAGSLMTSEIDEKQSWRRKHLKTIEMNYRNALFFDTNFTRLQEVILKPESLLAELAWHQLQFWLNEFGINTKVVRASDMPVHSKKSDLVLDLCRYFGASRYLSGELGKNYLNESDFAKSGIAIEYQSFKPSAYRQLWGEFLPGLSIVDYWMNCGAHLRSEHKEV